MEEIFPIVAIVAIIAAINMRNKYIRLAARINDLETIVRGLVAAQTSARVQQTPHIETASPVDTPVAPSAPPIFSPVAPPESKSATQLAQPKRIVPPPLPRKPSRTNAELEQLIGSKLLNRIGALALIIGVGLFLKYAFENNWITEPLRVGIGVICGAGLLVAAMKANASGFKVFSQGLVGAGISILYLSVYAAFNFYHLIPQIAAFGCMAVVTIITVLQARKYDSLAVMVLAWIGGFLTPILLSTNVSNEIGLFTYIALLDVGLLAVCANKESWFVIEPLSLIGTFMLYLAWYNKDYTTSALPETALFLTLFWLIFFALNIIHTLRSRGSYRELRAIVDGMNATIFYGLLYEMVDSQYDEWMGLITLLIGAVYGATALVLRRRTKSTGTINQYVLTGIILLVFATAIQFDGYVMVVFWSLEALALMWCGLRWDRAPVRYAALGLFLVLIGKLLTIRATAMGYPLGESFVPVFNGRMLAYFVAMISLCASAIVLRNKDIPFGKRMQLVLHVAWGALLFHLCWLEPFDIYRHWMQFEVGNERTYLSYASGLTIAAILLLYAIGMTWGGLRAKLKPVVGCGIGGSVVAVVLVLVIGFTYRPVVYFSPVLNERAALMLAYVAALIIAHRRVRVGSGAASWLGMVLPALQIGAALVTLDLITGETLDYFSRVIAMMKQLPGDYVNWSAVAHVENMQQLALSICWLVYAALLMATGLWRKIPRVRIMSIALFGIAVLKIFLYDLSFLETVYRTISFIGLGVILLAVSYIYQRYKNIILGEITPRTE